MLAKNLRRHVHRRLLGRAGECLAVWSLRLTGWSVFARNLRLRGVEVDLLARRGDTEALVEVKTRLRPHGGSGLESLISSRQRLRLERALAARIERSSARRLRLDLVEISLLPYPRVRRHVALPSLAESAIFGGSNRSLP